MKINNKYFLTSGILFAVFVLFTILVKVVDVKAIGPNGSKVGFASLNSDFFNAVGASSAAKIISNIIMYFAIACAVLFVVLFVYQWIKRKSIKKVDSNLIYFGICCVSVVIIYVFFEIVKINFRPVLDDGTLKASYPSSHTLIISTLLIITAFNLSYYVKNKNIKIAIYSALSVLCFVGVLCRALSGVHWLTDILAGLIISASIICLFLGLTNINKTKDEVKQEKNE